MPAIAETTTRLFKHAAEQAGPVPRATGGGSSRMGLGADPKKGDRPMPQAQITRSVRRFTV